MGGPGGPGARLPPKSLPDGRPASRRFRLVPFLVELRAVMDWVWTDTTLSLSSWMCVEDIYANIFIIKCSRETEKVPGHRPGVVLAPPQRLGGWSPGRGPVGGRPLAERA